MEGVVIIFDFDETIIDCDSDLWVADDLGVASLFNDLIKSMPWNAAAVTNILKI
jgi:pyridoxal phosphate phosphatase PHOSPHO2